jgi:pimeloyl-ACP methyl ester carboxylesterase
MLFGIILSFSAGLAAQASTPTIHAVSGGGDWDSISTWVEGAVPTSSDIVEINGTVTVSSDVSVSGLIISSGATLQNTNYYYRRVTVNGDVINNGTINNQQYAAFYLTVTGNITNNGTWNNSWTDLSSTQSRSISGTNPINSPVTFLNDFEILNSPVFTGQVNFNGKTITLASTDQELTLNHSTILSGAISGLGSLIISDAVVEGTITAPKIVFGPNSVIVSVDFTAGSFMISSSGILNVMNESVFNGPLTIESGGTLKNQSYYYRSLTVIGDVINNGSIIKDQYGDFYINVIGNITNNGIWSCGWTVLSSTQSRTIDGTTPLSGGIRFSGDFTILNSPIFNGTVDFNYSTIDLPNADQSMTINHNITLSGAISGLGSLNISDSVIDGTMTAPKIIFGPNSVILSVNLTASNFIIIGSGSLDVLNDSVFNGNLIVESGGVLKNKNYCYRSLTVNGGVTNNGSIAKDQYGDFYINITGNIINNGTWNCGYTGASWSPVLGAVGYLFNISSDNNYWPQPVSTANTSYSIAGSLSSPNYWRVRADLGNGLYSPWSDIRSINGYYFTFNLSVPEGKVMMATAPFTLTIQAKDINGNNFDYDGSVAIGASNGATTTPDTITTTDGYWSGTTTIAEFGSSIHLRAVSGGGSSDSNSFTVIKKPVIIVPGIVGTRLKASTTDEEIWPDVASMILSPSDDYLDELLLNNNGLPATSSVIISGDIIREIMVGFDHYHFFDGLISLLEDNGYTEGENLFVFPYDWRLDVGYIADNTFREKIESVKVQTGAQKVDIVAHSMGGLVIKKYIYDYPNSSVDKFIDIATPHLGAPKAAKTLLYGDDFDMSKFGIGLSEEKVKEIARNFSPIYQLLPSRNYYYASSTLFNSYILDSYDVDDNNVTGSLDYDESIDFLNYFGNLNLTSINDSLHNDIDSFNPNNYNIKAYNIIGCNNPTIGWIEIINKHGTSSYEYGLHYTNGDGTVPLESSRSLSNTVGTYYNATEDEDATHAFLPSFNGNRQLINSILSSTSSTPAFDFSSYPDIHQNGSYCTIDGWEVSYHSPIALHIYDEQGRHIGPDENGNIEINIPGAAYDVIGDNKFAFVPKGHNYRITGQATGLGHFNARIQDISKGNTVSTAYYNEVPIKSLGTNIEIDYSSNTPNYEMKIDQTGDKVFREKIKPDSILNAKESGDKTKPDTRAEIIGQTIKLTPSDDNSKILKTEYSLDGGKTWNIYSKPIDIISLDRSSIQYKSIDRAGNEEIIKEQGISINKNNKQILSSPRKIRF